MAACICSQCCANARLSEEVLQLDKGRALLGCRTRGLYSSIVMQCQ